MPGPMRRRLNGLENTMSIVNTLSMLEDTIPRIINHDQINSICIAKNRATNAGASGKEVRAAMAKGTMDFGTYQLKSRERLVMNAAAILLNLNDQSFIDARIMQKINNVEVPTSEKEKSLSKLEDACAAGVFNIPRFQKAIGMVEYLQSLEVPEEDVSVAIARAATSLLSTSKISNHNGNAGVAIIFMFGIAPDHLETAAKHILEVYRDGQS